MPACLFHDDPLKFISVPEDSPFHQVRNEIEWDVLFDDCRAPGHQDLVLLMSILSRQSRYSIAFAIQERPGILPGEVDRELMKSPSLSLFLTPAV